MTEMDRLIAERKELLRAASDAYASDAFPGTPRWLRANAAENAVHKFDAAHPEVVTEMDARRVAERKARLAGVDIFGL